MEERKLSVNLTCNFLIKYDISICNYNLIIFTINGISIITCLTVRNHKPRI